MPEQPHSQPIVMNMPKELIDAHIKALVLEAIGKNGDALITAMVDHVLKETVDYGRRTLLDKMIHELIQSTAKQASEEWVKEQGPAIRAAIRKRLDAGKSKVISDLCDQFVNTMTTTIRVNVSVGER